MVCREITNRIKSLPDSKAIEKILFQMINEGKIKAKIDSEKQMITFIDLQSMGGTS